MDELTIQELIKANYSGGLSELSTYVSLAIQAVSVLIGGILLWRVSGILHKKKITERSRNEFFNSSYSKGWKRK